MPTARRSDRAVRVLVVVGDKALANMVARHPGTDFVGAHVGCYAENLGWVGALAGWVSGATMANAAPTTTISDAAINSAVTGPYRSAIRPNAKGPIT